MINPAREQEWASWMRAAIAGDSRAYHKLLTAITPHLRVMARRRCDQFGAPTSEAEDVVQEVLLAIHLKRGTWDPARPLAPWISVLVRNKLIDSLRRRGRHFIIPLEDVEATLASEERLSASDRMDVEQILAKLRDPQRTIVQAHLDRGDECTGNGQSAQYDRGRGSGVVASRAEGVGCAIFGARNMKTKDLIKLLSQDAPVRISLNQALAHSAIAATIMAGTVFFGFIGFRADIDTAVESVRFLFKFVITIALAITAGMVLFRIGRPGASLRLCARALCLPVILIAGAVSLELLVMPSATWGARMIGHNAHTLSDNHSVTVGIPIGLFSARDAARRTRATGPCGGGRRACFFRPCGNVLCGEL
ncbi:RNA polymerase sigma factor (sigma-70 family) [Rhizobium laguerreae]